MPVQVAVGRAMRKWPAHRGPLHYSCVKVVVVVDGEHVPPPLSLPIHLGSVCGAPGVRTLHGAESVRLSPQDCRRCVGYGCNPLETVSPDPREQEGIGLTARGVDREVGGAVNPDLNASREL